MLLNLDSINCTLATETIFAVNLFRYVACASAKAQSLHSRSSVLALATAWRMFTQGGHAPWYPINTTWSTLDSNINNGGTQSVGKARMCINVLVTSLLPHLLSVVVCVLMQ
jgi:hypothetical protein